MKGGIIIRILGKGQYTINKDILAELNRLDNDIVRLLNKNGDERKLRVIVRKMIKLVVKNGKKIDPNIIIPSRFIIPADDVTLEEAKKMFEGEGIIPEDIL